MIKNFKITIDGEERENVTLAEILAKLHEKRKKPSLSESASDFINIASLYNKISKGNSEQITEIKYAIEKNRSRFPERTIDKKLIDELHNILDSKSEKLLISEYRLDFPKFEESIITESHRLKKIITNIYAENEIIYSVDPRKFEEIIAELLYHKGFKVELTKQTRDNGYDILALQDLNGFPLKFLVECKRYAKKRPVGIDIIRSFSDVIKEEKANKGIIFTTSYFTKDSKKRKDKEGYILDFMDRLEIMKWIEEYIEKNNAT